MPIAQLRQRIAGVVAPVRKAESDPFDLSGIDGRLADGGISRSALHNFAAATPSLADDAGNDIVSRRHRRAIRMPGSSVLWAVPRFDLYAPGLERAGLPPERALFVEARDNRQVLAEMEVVLRHGSLGAVVGQVNRTDMTAARRLQLAAA